MKLLTLGIYISIIVISGIIGWFMIKRDEKKGIKRDIDMRD